MSKQGEMLPCPDGLLPDGPVCPQCGKERAASGVGGGTWVHFDSTAPVKVWTNRAALAAAPSPSGEPTRDTSAPDNRNDTMEYWRDRALIAEIKVQEFAKEFARPVCPFHVGDHIRFVGGDPERWFRTKVNKITEPEVGNWVLWTGCDNFPVNFKKAELIQ